MDSKTSNIFDRIVKLFVKLFGSFSVDSVNFGSMNLIYWNKENGGG